MTAALVARPVLVIDASSAAGLLAVAERGLRIIEAEGLKVAPWILQDLASLRALACSGLGPDRADDGLVQPHAPSPPASLTLTTREAAQLLNLHPRTIRKAAERGALAGRLGSGGWLFERMEIERWRRSRTR